MSKINIFLISLLFQMNTGFQRNVQSLQIKFLLLSYIISSQIIVVIRRIIIIIIILCRKRKIYD